MPDLMPPTRLRPYVGPATALAVAVLHTAVVFAILRLGFLPLDDALRHTARAVSQRPWMDVLVLREEFQRPFESHPGWHQLLTAGHVLLGADATTLLLLCVLGGWVAVALPFVAGLRRPEVWPVVLAAVLAVYDSPMFRWVSGRPFVFSVAGLCGLLLAWGWFARAPRDWRRGAVLAALVALPAALHTTSWFLFLLPTAGGLLTGRWRVAVPYALWITAGLPLGLLLTGDPSGQFRLSLEVLQAALFDQTPPLARVTEFQPLTNFGLLPFLVALFLWRLRARNPGGPGLAHPAFAVAVLGWIGGLLNTRLWADWGCPALLVWLCLEAQARWARTVPRTSLLRPALAVVGGLLLVLMVASPARDVFKVNLPGALRGALRADPTLKAWLPEAGGVLYSTDNTPFYAFYHVFPDAPWRYAVGMEQGLMPEADRRVLERYRQTEDVRALAPWVARMGLADRVSVPLGQSGAFPELEWRECGFIMLGRRPRPPGPAGGEGGGL